ncbi:MAG: 50S ribosomal protein L6 [Actinomycetota bacterium]
MSRIGKMPVEVPNGVDVEIGAGIVTAKGPLGTLQAKFPDVISVRRSDDTLVLERPSDNREHKAFHGLARALVANIVHGVSTGFERALEIQGVGYRAQLQGQDLVLQVGYSHPVDVPAPDGITFEVPAPTRVVVKGASKELVGQTAANIRKIRPPEPYKGKGIRYEGEAIRRKVGKAAK